MTVSFYSWTLVLANLTQTQVNSHQKQPIVFSRCPTEIHRSKSKSTAVPIFIIMKVRVAF